MAAHVDAHHSASPDSGGFVTIWVTVDDEYGHVSGRPTVATDAPVHQERRHPVVRAGMLAHLFMRFATGDIPI